MKYKLLIMDSKTKMMNIKIAAPAKHWVLNLLNSAGLAKNSKKKHETPPLPLADKRKTAALEDFKSWLDERPSLEEGQGLDVVPDTCDLFSLMTEFTALRQEIRLQNREQYKTLKILDGIRSVTDEYKDALHMFQEKSRDLVELENRIRLVAENKTAALFFDLRDNLVRGYQASLETSQNKSFFRPPPKGVEKICQGYEIAIRRFDKALAKMDIIPIQTIGRKFDPGTMKAFETKKKPGTDKGVVLEEISSGFVKNNEVLKFANVIVAQ